MTIVTAIVAAAIPTIVYTLLIWWLDRYEKEPLPLLLVALFWGALPAVLLVFLIDPLVISRQLTGPPTSDIVVTPAIEEVTKAIVLVALFWLARRDFDGPLDGIVYGALVGFGFSMTENALYFYYKPDLNDLWLLRAILFGLNHALFSAMVGLALGLVRYRPNFSERLGGFLLGLFFAILFHATHNFLVASFFGAVLSWVVQMSGVLVILAVAVLAWRHERAWLQTELGDELRQGVLSLDEYNDVISSSLRARRQMDALLAGGWARFRQVRQLHHLLTQLAFRKSQLATPDPGHHHESPAELRRAILQLRQQFESDEVVY
jgi:RsiW-degrading membrane proteinase PrsW (M82 family)